MRRKKGVFRARLLAPARRLLVNIASMTERVEPCLRRFSMVRGGRLTATVDPRLVDGSVTPRVVEREKVSSASRKLIEVSTPQASNGNCLMRRATAPDSHADRQRLLRHRTLSALCRFECIEDRIDARRARGASELAVGTYHDRR